MSGGGIFQEGLQRAWGVADFATMAFGSLFVIGVVKQAIFAIFSWKGGVSGTWWRHSTWLIGGGFLGVMASQLFAFLASGQ